MGFFIKGLSTATISGKIDFKVPVKPLFIEAFIDIILFIPFSVKCYLLFIKLTNDDNKIKSACF